MGRILLGIDLGTSSCKAAAFDEDGTVLAQTSRPYKVYYPKAGWAEQDVNDWWAAICACTHEILSNGKVDPEAVCGVGVDGWSWACVPVDRDGNALARTPLWIDTRAQAICDRVVSEIGEDTIFEIAGNSFVPSYSTPKMLWFKEERPEIFARTYKFLQSNSYIVYRLTGVMSQDCSQGYGIHFFNMKTMKYEPELAEKMGLSVELVPDLYACDQVVGEVTQEAARETGIRPGTPVVAGGLDAACGTLGAGVYKTGQTQEQGGQAGGMSICTDSAIAHKKLILSPHVVPGKWLLQGGTVGGGASLKWFKEQFGKDLSFDELTQEAAAVPAGSDGVVFLPYMSGERTPLWNPDAKGVFYGLSFDKTHGHLVRAVLEGVAFALEHNLRTAEEVGVYAEVMNSMGGASNSLLWTQIKSDVTGRRIDVPSSDTATTQGVCILAGIGCGVYRSYDEAIQKTVHITRTHFPDPERHAIYQKQMELYLELYEDLKDTFSKFK